MNNDFSEQVENDFLAIKSKVSEEQWNSSEYLLSYAKDIEESYPELSVRIMKRVKYLNNWYAKKVKSKIQKDEEANNSVPGKTEAGAAHSIVPKKSKNKVKKDEKSNNGKVSNKLGGVNLKQTFKKPFFIFVVFPWLVFFFYQMTFAAPRYVSQSKIIVEKPDSAATMDTGMAILSGLGVESTSKDAELVKAFIYSSDLLEYLDKKLDLKDHYETATSDYFSKLEADSSKESFYAYYEKHVEVTIDDKSQVITVIVQGFTPDFSHKLNNEIVSRAETYINEISNKLATEQLRFIQKENQLIEAKIKETKKQLLELQNQYGLIDPEAEGMAMQKITYSMEAMLAQKKAELKAAKNIMNDNAPPVTNIVREIQAIEEQLKLERNRLADNDGGDSVSEVLSKFIGLKVDMELALKAYASSQLSLEKSRVEAYRQVKYLVTVEKPTIAEDSTYPDITYNLALLAVILLMLFSIGRIIHSTIIELTK
ncbi:lipopolysaccharide biosynthesis protein [Kangiella shandongensis]|uniref:lipopolysaccharide biosynthesis protein n=1 Tax=Kangiella shandongensis TaxID=2763258 RepID=UPI001CBE262E|nr:lipopolysaccharide biosynthesis protein [Kangiella shandongensis]